MLYHHQVQNNLNSQAEKSLDYDQAVETTNVPLRDIDENITNLLANKIYMKI